jgi:hypothetical protein
MAALQWPEKEPMWPEDGAGKPDGYRGALAEAALKRFRQLAG